MPKAIVLLSGGLDSITCLAIAQAHGYDVTALSFHYGQRHTAELNAARQIAQRYGVADHRVFNLALNDFGGSALTDAAIAVPEQQSSGIPVTYVPARNTVFLALALGLAEVQHAEAIFIGVNAVDYSGYPDCRPEFIQAFAELARLATRVGVEGHAIAIKAPLQFLSKAEIIQTGLKHGVDYSLTVSCYQADDQGRACGRCDACRLRKEGFEQAHINDPTRYRIEDTSHAP